MWLWTVQIAPFRISPPQELPLSRERIFVSFAERYSGIMSHYRPVSFVVTK
jgi:hypothetical protein